MKLKRSLAFILALAMLFTETTAFAADVSDGECAPEEIIEETVDVSAGEINEEETENISYPIVEVETQPTNNSFIRTMEVVSMEGLSVKVTEEEGEPEILYYDSTEWCNFFKNNYTVWQNGRKIENYVYASALPAGKYTFIFTYRHDENIKIEVPVTITEPKVTHTLVIGGSVKLDANTQSGSGRSDTPHIVAMDLAAGQTYHISVDEKAFTAAFSGKMYYPVSYSEYNNYFYLDGYWKTGMIFTPDVSGTYYFSVMTSDKTTVYLEKDSKIVEAELVTGPYTNIQIRGIQQIPWADAMVYGSSKANEYAGVSVKLTFENGETKVVSITDPEWSYYGLGFVRSLYTKEEGYYTGWYDDTREVGKYYTTIGVLGMGDVSGNGDKLDIDVVNPNDEAIVCATGTPSYFAVSADGKDFVGSRFKSFPVEAGKTYKISSYGDSVLYRWNYYPSKGDFSQSISYSGLVSANQTLVAEYDGFWILGLNPKRVADGDLSKAFILVEEIEAVKKITSINVFFENESETWIDTALPEPSDATITLTFSDETTDTFSVEDDEKIDYYNMSVFLATYKDGEYTQVPRDNTKGKYPVGQYVYYFGVRNSDVRYIAENHPVKVVSQNYSIVYNSNYPVGTNKTVAQTIKSTTDRKLLANTFAVTGYTFVGWTTEPNAVLEPNDDAIGYEDKETFYGFELVNGKVNLYAVWRKNTYKITYHLAGGNWTEEYEAPSSYVYGETVELADISKVVSKTGYIIGTEWYSDSACTKKAEKVSATTAGNVHYYAKWNPDKLTVKFDANGGTGTMTDQIFYYGVDQNIKANTFKKANCVFAGWHLSDRELLFKNKECIDASTFYNHWEGTNTVTFEAVWDTKISVTLDVAGGEPLEKWCYALNYGETLTLPTPARTGYQFLGWYSDNGTKYTKIEKKTYADGKESSIIALTARWKAVSYTVSLEPNGGSGKKKTQKTTYDTSLNLLANPYKKTGYEFKGWVTAEYAATAKAIPAGKWEEVSETLGTIYADGQTVSNLVTKNNATIKLYAVWLQQAYTISFDAMGGNELASKTGHVYGSNDVTLYSSTEVIRDGYKFEGWYKEATYKTKIDDSKVKTLAANTTLYAKWSATYTVVFDGNGATSGTMASKNFKYGTAAQLTNNAFKKTGYVFDGWAYTSDAAKGVLKNKSKISTPTLGSDMKLVLYAVWRNEFDINYSIDADTFFVSSRVNSYTYGQTTSLPTVSREGFKFEGWYTDAKLKNKANIKATTSGDLTLYPKWSGLKYSVVFNANTPAGAKISGKTKTQSLTYGSSKKLNKNGYKITGYAFKGWATSPNGAVVYTNAQAIKGAISGYSSTINLYAVWELVEYKVTIKIVGISDSDKIYTYTVKDGFEFEDVNYLGYSFAGLYTDKKCKKKAGGLKVGTTGNKTLYARYILNK